MKLNQSSTEYLESASLEKKRPEGQITAENSPVMRASKKHVLTHSPSKREEVEESEKVEEGRKKERLRKNGWKEKKWKHGRMKREGGGGIK